MPIRDSTGLLVDFEIVSPEKSYCRFDLPGIEDELVLCCCGAVQAGVGFSDDGVPPSATRVNDLAVVNGAKMISPSQPNLYPDLLGTLTEPDQL